MRKPRDPLPIEDRWLIEQMRKQLKEPVNPDLQEVYDLQTRVVGIVDRLVGKVQTLEARKTWTVKN
jgi:hypothetical protein